MEKIVKVAQLFDIYGALLNEKQRDVIGWTQVERGTSEIYFLINTAEFIPHRYFIDVRVHTKLELIQHTKLLEFDIVNEAVENCNYE